MGLTHVFCLFVLFTMAIIKSVEGDATLCKGKEHGEPCGDDGDHKACVCANENIVAKDNAGKGSPCGGNGQLVCKVTKCFSISGRKSKPKMKNGKYIICFDHSNCGQNYMCTNYEQTDKPGFCCHSANGKAAIFNPSKHGGGI